MKGKKSFHNLRGVKANALKEKKEGGVSARCVVS